MNVLDLALGIVYVAEIDLFDGSHIHICHQEDILSFLRTIPGGPAGNDYEFQKVEKGGSAHLTRSQLKHLRFKDEKMRYFVAEVFVSKETLCDEKGEPIYNCSSEFLVRRESKEIVLPWGISYEFGVYNREGNFLRDIKLSEEQLIRLSPFVVPKNWIH